MVSSLKIWFSIQYLFYPHRCSVLSILLISQKLFKIHSIGKQFWGPSSTNHSSVKTLAFTQEANHFSLICGQQTFIIHISEAVPFHIYGNLKLYIHFLTCLK